MSDLRRYTDLASLFSLLLEKKLALRDPGTWDDLNDRYFLELYKREYALESLFALCFVRAPERYHFWQVFAPGRSGIRIRFHAGKLLKTIARYGDVRAEKVHYRRLTEVKYVPIKQYPFVKRYGFIDEEEFRFIYESKTLRLGFEVPIELSCIQSIKVNPWLSPSQFRHVREVIHSLKDCGSLDITHSRLTNSETWKSAGDRAIARFSRAGK
jgi:hypothetical protein